MNFFGDSYEFYHLKYNTFNIQFKKKFLFLDFAIFPSLFLWYLQQTNLIL